MPKTSILFFIVMIA